MFEINFTFLVQFEAAIDDNQNSKKEG